MRAVDRREPLPQWGAWGLGLILVWALVSRLLFASVGLEERRFWDERYSVENVSHMLATGSLEAVSWWYPVPSYLPHTALLAVARRVQERSGDAEPLLRRDGGFSPMAYLLCRSLQAVFGTISLLLLFVLVRRFDGWREGLLATLLLAATPNHLRLSVFFKPDVLLLGATLLAVLVSVRLVEDGRRRGGEGLDGWWLWRTAAAGATVALAASMNLDGVIAAVPISLAVLLAAGTWRRRVVGLVVAGTTSAALFLVANPSWRLQLEYLQRIRRQYLEQSVGHGHLDVLKGELEVLLSPAFFGPLLGAVGIVGWLLLAAGVVRRFGTPTDRLPSLAVALSFPLAFSAIFAVSTTYAKENRFLVVAPWVAWGAALLLSSGGERLWALAQGSGARRRLLRPALLGVATALVGSLVWQSSHLVYDAKVPATASLLAQRVNRRLEPLPWRLVWVETVPGSEPVSFLSWRDRAAVVEVPSLLDVAAPELVLGDGLVFSQRRLQEAQSGAYHELLKLYGDGSERVAVVSHWLQARGPGLVAVIDPWTAVGDVAVIMEREATREWRGKLPAAGRSGVLSLRVWLPRPHRPPSLEIDGEVLPFVSTRIDGRQDRYLSPRLREADGADVRLRLTEDVQLERPPVLEVRYWSRNEAP